MLHALSRLKALEKREGEEDAGELLCRAFSLSGKASDICRRKTNSVSPVKASVKAALTLPFLSLGFISEVVVRTSSTHLKQNSSHTHTHTHRALHMPAHPLRSFEPTANWTQKRRDPSEHCFVPLRMRKSPRESLPHWAGGTSGSPYRKLNSARALSAPPTAEVLPTQLCRRVSESAGSI